ncbi:MAG TPA: thiolase family protein [Rhodocyclaceae bacterium]|nr:thiolase family protein [Rhodocyclaceae bacterium]
MKPLDRALGRVAAIVGMGDAYADKEHVKDPLQLASEASWAAFRDADITKDQIDVLLTGRAPWADRRPQWNNIFASHLQMPVRMTTELTFHGAGVNAMIGQAALAVASGAADYVLCVQADAVELFIDATAVGAATDACPQFEFPYGPTIPTIYAQLACRYMHEFGVTEEDFAEVAVQRQEWAVHHPKAAKRKHGLITVDDVMRSPYISSPLRRWMCATWGPGGTAGAFIVTSVERAARAKNPIYIRGFGTCTTHEYLCERINLRKSTVPLGTLPAITTTGAAHAAREAYAMADMKPEDMDMAAVAGNFAHTFLVQLEDLGFAPKGRAMDLVRSGRMRPGGDFPVDTNGGWMGFGQPGISVAADSLVETIRQLRGNPLGLKAGNNPKTAMAYSAGGMLACHSAVILSTEKA